MRKSLNDTLRSHPLKSVSIRAESQPVTKRDNKNEIRTSLDKFRHAYGIEKASPVKRIRYNSRRTSARQVAFNSETSRSGGRTLEPKTSFDRTYATHINCKSIRQVQEKDRENKTKLASFSPFSTIKSREKEIRAHKKKLKSKKALSKLDKIYSELQTMEKDFKDPALRL